jgi:hypothetical protein
MLTNTKTLDLFSTMGMRPASSNCHGLRIPSGILHFDDFLEGGLPANSLCEWGSPLGQGGRELLLRYVAQLTRGHVADEIGQRHPQWVLWVHHHEHTRVYPPAWQARGVSLRHIRFATSTQPLIDLKPAFLEPFFRMVVLDGTFALSKDDLAFLARQARYQRITIVVLRNFLLSEERGNVWAKLRLNAVYDPEYQDGSFLVTVIRGGMAPRSLSFAQRRGLHE